MSLRLAIACSALVLASAALTSCGSSTSKTAATSTAPTYAPAYVARGPHQVGVTTLTMAGATPRKVEVYYPALTTALKGVAPDVFKMSGLVPANLRAAMNLPPDQDAPLLTNTYRDVTGDRAAGPFPVVAFSHGLGGYPTEYQQILGHIASWGFVVVAPDHFERGLTSLLSDKIVQVDEKAIVLGAVATARAASAATTGPLAGVLQPTGKIVVAGHSAGTVSAYDTASNPSVAGMILISGGGMFKDSAAPVAPKPTVPALFLQGETDEVVPPAISRQSFDALTGPREWAEFKGAGHLSFTDICTIGRDKGGIIEIARRAGLLKLLPPGSDTKLAELGTDGCLPKWIKAEETWPGTDHLLVAFIRWTLHLDSTPKMLDPGLSSRLGPATITIEQQGVK